MTNASRQVAIAMFAALTSFSSLAATEVTTQTPIGGDAVAASALLAIDQNRTTIIDRIVNEWGDRLIAAGTGVSRDQLKEMLFAMRADQLLAASIAGSLDGLKAIFVTALPSAAKVRMASAGGIAPAALGDATADLVYTPVTPCRIVDSRSSSGGVLQSGQVRNWLAANPSGNFITQGGAATNCGIPVKPAAVLVNLTVANTTGSADFLTVWPFGVARPNASTLNWTAGGQQIANAVIIPLCTGGGCTSDFSSYASSQTDLIGDVLGYFAPPVATALDCTTIQNQNTVTHGTFGDVSASCTTGYALSGGGCTYYNLDGSAATQNTVFLNRSAQTRDPNTSEFLSTWGCRLTNNDPSTDFRIAARVLCCRVPGR